MPRRACMCGVVGCKRHRIRQVRYGPNPYGAAHQAERRRVGKGPKVCGICRREILEGQAWHLDHVVPISMGGVGGPTQPAHAACNISKGGKNRRRSP